MPKYNQITGYDKASQNIMHEMRIAPYLYDEIRKLFNVPDEDKNLEGGAYPLPKDSTDSLDNIDRLADYLPGWIKVADVKSCEWFLEAYWEPPIEQPAEENVGGKYAVLFRMKDGSIKYHCVNTEKVGVYPTRDALTIELAEYIDKGEIADTQIVLIEI